MQKMGMAALAALGAWLGIAAPATAGDYTGDTLVRVQGTVVIPDSSAKVYSGGALQAGWDADVSTEVIPTLTITHFFTKNVAAELFCCFGRFNAKGRGGIDGLDLGSFWVFPPILTLQYHFDPIGGFKPYVGAGVQYIHFFDGGQSDLQPEDQAGRRLGLRAAGRRRRRDWQGLVSERRRQEGLARHGCKSWGSTGVTAKVTVDPLIVSAGLGYRFNLSDLLGGRPAPRPLK